MLDVSRHACLWVVPMPSKYTVCVSLVLGCIVVFRPCPATMLPRQSTVTESDQPRLLEVLDEPRGVDRDISLLDGAASMMRQTPGPVHIVYFPGPCDLPGKPLRLARSIQGYLTSGRGISPSRIKDPIIGPGQAIARAELWLGNDPPKVGSTVEQPLPIQAPFLFDAYYVAFTCELLPEPGWEDFGARLDAFAAILKANPQLTGHLLTYSAWDVHDDNNSCPVFSRAELDAERAYLTQHHGINPDRVVLRRAGRAKFRLIELWLAQRGRKVPRHRPVTIARIIGTCP